MMQVLVICGTGFIGAPLLRRLHAAGHAVTVYHRGTREPELPDGVRHIRDARAAVPVLEFPEALFATPYDVVIHMTLIGERDAEAIVHAFSGRARRLVVVSSGDVYAAHGQLLGLEPPSEHSGPLLTEDSPLRAGRYPYGRRVPGPWGELVDYDKILVEEVVHRAPDLATTVIRLPAVYGRGDPHHRFLPWIKRMEDGRPAILLGEGAARWRFTHGYVENVAVAIALVATDDRAVGRTYHVGEAHTPTVIERVAVVARATGWRGQVVVVPDDRLPAHLRSSYHYVADLAYDTSRIRSELGYAEPITDADAMRVTMRWERGAGLPVADHARFDYAAEDAVLAGLPLDASVVQSIG